MIARRAGWPNEVSTHSARLCSELNLRGAEGEKRATNANGVNYTRNRIHFEENWKFVFDLDIRFERLLVSARRQFGHEQWILGETNKRINSCLSSSTAADPTAQTTTTVQTTNKQLLPPKSVYPNYYILISWISIYVRLLFTFESDSLSAHSFIHSTNRTCSAPLNWIWFMAFTAREFR